MGGCMCTRRIIWRFSSGARNGSRRRLSPLMRFGGFRKGTFRPLPRRKVSDREVSEIRLYSVFLLVFAAVCGTSERAGLCVNAGLGWRLANPLQDAILPYNDSAGCDFFAFWRVSRSGPRMRFAAGCSDGPSAGVEWIVVRRERLVSAPGPRSSRLCWHPS